ncbi:MAG: autotransporter-associated beta strand repeat-containing protein, partial [Kiritimatiellae bacterium]|nr:autotransporter-associated beta strand repeat-containing protein [Kiritimatiellia bacterium]
LGTGPVKVAADGTLRFANASPLTVANAITGEGMIEFAGTAPVTLASTEGFVGTRRATVGVTTAGYDLVKEGGDTLTLTAANTYGGETRVLGGTLALGPRPPDALPCPEAISLRLDADDAGSRTMNGDHVVAWADADGRGITFTNSATATSPVLNEGAINGRDSLFFGGLLHRMVSDKGVAARTVFIVNKFPPQDTPHPNKTVGKSGWNYAGIIGDVGVDCGIRVMAAGTWIKNDWTDSANIYCNGRLTTSFNWDTPQISTFALTRTHDGTARIVVGDYWGTTAQYRSYYGDIAEVLVYDRHLEDAERQAVEAYLGAKWGIAVEPVGVATNVLPVTTDVTVADGAALDLAGRVQTVASIAGAGAVTNSSLAQATLTLGSLDGFTGTLAGNILLDVRGTTTLAADATIDPGIDLHLAPGTILDLGGRTVTVRNASGNGVVRNGTLIVTGQDNRLSPATMIIFR